MVQIYNFFLRIRMIIRKNSFFCILFSASSSFLSFFQLSLIPNIKIHNNIIIFPNIFGDYRKKSYLCNVYQRIVQQYLSDRELKNKNIYIKRRKETL